MSSLESLLSELNRAIAAKREQEGAPAPSPIATLEEPDKQQVAEQARAALVEFFNSIKAIEPTAKTAEESDTGAFTARTQALESFLGAPIERSAPYVPPPAPAGGHSTHGGGHGSPHARSGGHGGGSHGSGGHGGHGSHGTHGAPASSDLTGGQGGGDNAPPRLAMCKTCAKTIAPGEEFTGTPAPAPAPAPPPPPAAPPAPLPASAANIAAAGQFPWKRYITAVETALRQKDLPVAENLLKVLNDVAEFAPVEVPVRVRLVTQLANIGLEKKDCAGAQKMLVGALQMVEGTEFKKSVATAYALDALAQCYQMMDKYDHAEKTRRAAVIIAEETLGGEHPDTAFFRERQEELRQERGVAMLGTDEASRTVLDKLTDEYNAAVAAGQAPQVAAASQGDNVSGFMYDKYLSNGKNALAQKNLREAESCLRSAMEKGQGLADSDPRKCEGIRLLAMTIDLSGKPQDAIPLYENALTLAFKFIGWSDVQVAHSLASLAELHNKINDVGTARNYYKQAVATYSLALGKDHETTVALQAAYDAFMERMKEERKWKGWSN